MAKMKKEVVMLSRREMVGKLAAGTAVVVAATQAGSAKAVQSVVPSEPTGEPVAEQAKATDLSHVVDSGVPITSTATPPWALFAPLAVGSPLSHGWRVASLSGVVDGSCVLTLENDQGRSR